MHKYDYKDHLNSLISSYKRDNSVLEINFKELLPELKIKERYTHSIHSYPSKLIAHIPNYFINNTLLSKEGDTVLDPFCGSGTVLLEAKLANRKSIGIDINPLSCLISKVKTYDYQDSKLLDLVNDVRLANSRKMSIGKFDVRNLAYWYSTDAIRNLSKIGSIIREVPASPEKDLLLLSFSKTARIFSFADPRISVPVRINPDKFPKGSRLFNYYSNRLKWISDNDPFEFFINSIESDIHRIQTLVTHKGNIPLIIQDDFITTDELDNTKVQLIITSPPYNGAQKYVRSTFLNLGWTDLCSSKDLLSLNMNTIGRESNFSNFIEYNFGIKEIDCSLENIKKVSKDRWKLSASYLYDMMLSMKKIYDLLIDDGFAVIILGNSRVVGTEFLTSDYIYLLAKQIGFKTHLRINDDIKSWGLMTKRNKTASVINSEQILLLQKG
jgi:DNA modification methylase